MEKTFAEIRKYSYIRKIVGESNYEELRKAAKKYVPIATCILVVLLVLTHFVHWELLNWLIKCTLGTSLLFLAYVFGVILLLDFGVDVEMRKEWNGSLSAPEIMPPNFKRTIIWAYTLFVLGIAAIYFSHKYKKNYDFECQTFLVDEDAGIYHLDEDVHEECIEYTTEMKGYELKKYDYTFCESCKEWQDEMDEYVYERR